MAFIAVHAGAGYHGINQREDYLKACRDACEKAMMSLKQNCSAVDGVVHAISLLEDNGITNAGLGSNLNANGFVECDASVMSATCDPNECLNWGAVGAIQKVKNPINAAKLVLNEQLKTLPLGLVAPNLLVGDGATLWAINNGCVSANLITNKSKDSFNKYKRRLESVTKGESNGATHKQSRLDTVGAVCVDNNGNIASGVSSGGIALKQHGRIGQAAMMGCGCWAQQGVAVTTSGIGEYLIKTLFAKECATNLLSSDDHNYVNALNSTFKTCFFESPFLKTIAFDDRLAGVIALIYDKNEKHYELLWAHSTASMCIGYMNSTHSVAKAIVSELPLHSKPGHSITIQSTIFS